MATTLSLALLLVAITCLAIASLVGLRRGVSIADGILRSELEAEAAGKATEVDSVLRVASEQLDQLAESPALADALRQIDEATDALDAIPPSSLVEETDALSAHYEDDVLPTLAAMRGRDVGLREVLPERSAAIYLQYHYVVAGDAAESEAVEIDDAGDGSDWSAVHARLHPKMRLVAEQAGVDDILLVAGSDNQVVYSVAKGPELGASLRFGPLSGSNAALVTGEAIAAGGDVVAVDVGAYAADGDRPVGFLGAAVMADGDAVGAVIMRLPVASLVGTMTSDGEWEARGLGATGESYLVGRDGRLRTESRAFLEDRTTFLAEAEERDAVAADQLRQMEVSGTSILFQKADRDTIDAALDGTGYREGVNYTGHEVMTAHRPIDSPLLPWAVIAERERDEATTGVGDFTDRLVVATTLATLVLTFAAAAWAAREVRPLRIVGARLRSARQEDLLAAPAPPPPWAAAEFVDIHDGVEEMLRDIENHRADLEAVRRERQDLLATLLPEQVLRQLEAGDRHLHDTIPEASVVVAVVHGLSRLGEARTLEEHRRLLARLVDALDDLAEELDLQRIKLVGDAYVATCGTAQPVLDHAPRAVRFALAAGDAVAEIGGDLGLALSVGIDSGRVETGLTGPHRLVYDVWGDTVIRAGRLARAGQPGQILASARIAADLPDELTLVPVAGAGGNEPAVEVRAGAGPAARDAEARR